MPSAHLTLREEDVVRLALEFLHNRDMHISQLSLERETGVINGSYSDDVLFLRQLILDGQWDDVLEFIQPLETLPAFDMKKFKYYILRRKYEELLCIKSEATLLSGTGNSVDNAVEEVVKVLRELEKVVPSKEEYSHLCLLLTLPKLNDHLSYKDWNPSHARVQCFREILPIVEKFLPNDKKSHGGFSFSKNDRLIQLVIKGILYESCVNYCQSKATGTADPQCQEINFTRILDGNVGLGDSDLSLISWLQCVPSDTFSIPFEQRTLNVDVEKLDKPTLETSWTEHMLVTPIKPKTFPHSAMPFTRPRSAADVMSRSLLPAFEGLGQGLAPSRNASPLLMAFSTGEVNPHLMTRSSFASFHLTGFKNNKLMNTSVDRLFENDNEEVFLSTTYADFQPTASVVETSTPKQNVIPRKQSKSPDSKKNSNISTTASSPDQRGRDSPSSTARSSRRDSLVDKPIHNIVPQSQIVNGNGSGDNFDGDLMKEFQKQKQKFQETLIAKGKQREELLRQMQEPSPKVPEECSRASAEISSNKSAHLNKTGSSTKVSVPVTAPVNGVGGKNSNFESDDQYDVVKDKMTAEASALRRLEALFENVNLDDESRKQNLSGKRNSGHFFFERTILEERLDKNCNVHGRDSRRGSIGNIPHSNRKSFSGTSSRRDSMPTIIHNHPPLVRRDSGGLGLPPAKSQDPMVHPSSFPSSLRKNSITTSTGNLRRDSIGASTGNLRGTVRRDSISSVGSSRRDSSLGRRFSTDSLEHRRNSWDPGRRGSSSSSGGVDETIFENSVNGKMIPDGFHLPVFMTGCPIPPKPVQRPWPPIYRQNNVNRSFYFRPQEPPPWVDYPRMNGYREKGRDYYYLAPLYRHAMPPPPQPIELSPPRRVMLLNPHPKKCFNECPCLHRSRSLEDVRSEISEWSDDEPPPSRGYRFMNKKVLEVPPSRGFGDITRRYLDDSVKMDARKKGRPKPAPLESENGSGRPKFVAVTTLEDVQAVRCAEFHPSGKVYAIGSNSKTLRICAYPKLTDLREEHSTYQPAVLFKRTRHHKGSIYCMAWTPIGDLMATGSNDKTVKLMKFNPETSNLEGQEIELTMHDGTVRDLCFLEDTSNKSSLLISGGAGDCKIYVTDCATGSPYQALGGHGGHVLSLYNWGGAMFVSGSQDKTVRFWDLRVRGCVNMVTPVTAPGNRGSPVAAVCVDPSGRLLVSGHEDSSCVLYDIRGGRNVQCFKPHSADIRSIRFSPSAYYLLTGGYDNKLVLTDLQGDLTLPLPSVVVAQHQDKVISGRWHPTEFSFLSTSADKTCTLWALPPI